MKANYMCLNYLCTYSTNNRNNLSIEGLKKKVSKEGGNVETNHCPKCDETTLRLIADSIDDKPSNARNNNRDEAVFDFIEQYGDLLIC